MIEIEKLTKSYGEQVVLRGFSAQLPDSGVVCVTGVSGRGKTTLLRILAGLEPADSGVVKGIAGRRIAYVFQEDRLLPWISAAQNIRLAQPQEAAKTSEDLLAMAGLAGEGAKRPGELSGGQRRRVAFLRGIAFLDNCQDGVLLLDEPFNGLDEGAAEEICRIIQSLPVGTLTVLVTHQPEPARRLNAVFLAMD